MENPLNQTNPLMNKIQKRADKFYGIALKRFAVLKKLYGTKFIVTKPLENSKYKKVFGAAYTTYDRDNTQSNKRDVILIINMKEMIDIWNSQMGQLEVYDKDNLLERGELLESSRDGRIYYWKVEAVKTFGEGTGTIYQFTLSPSQELT